MRKPLIMIPGTLCDSTLFQYQQTALQDLADCQVADHSSADSLEEVAANILAAVQGPFSIMGLSYGGIIAFELWRQAAERIERMILLNTNHQKPSDTTRANQQRFLGMSVLGEFREITTDFLKDAMLHPAHARQSEMRSIVLDMALNTGNIQCPTLIMTGREDKVCTPAMHDEMAKLIPNSTLAIIEHCGHLSTLEQPEEINKIIKNWW